MSYSTLVDRIEQELTEIREIVTRTERFAKQVQLTEADPYQDALISAIALSLHSFYTGAERIFEAIARTFDYREPTGADWHRQLLDQMCVAIPEVRRAVISESTRTALDEFRRFRHVVRSLYAYKLETSRVLELANQLQRCHQDLEREIRHFLEFLEK